MFTNTNVLTIRNNISKTHYGIPNGFTKEISHQSHVNKSKKVSSPSYSDKDKTNNYTPFQKDKLFWCFYIIYNGYENYELHKTDHFIIEKQFKINTIEKMAAIKDKLKIFKIKLAEIEDEFVYQTQITVKGLQALCLCYNVSILYVAKRTYYDFNHRIDEDGKTGVIVKEETNFNNKTSINYDCDVNTIKTTYLHIENSQKPIKSASSYTIKELQELCKKLDIIITNEHGKNKLKNVLYQEILTKV
jgi:hypothetical protein